MKIYLKETDIPLTNTREALIKKFLENKAYTSYNNPECTDIQCENGKYRSITELHSIVETRFPKTSLLSIIRILKKIIDKNNNVILVYCTTVNKVVVKFEPNKSSKWISDYSLKNYYQTKGVDNYSLKDFELMKEKL